MLGTILLAEFREEQQDRNNRPSVHLPEERSPVYRSTCGGGSSSPTPTNGRCHSLTGHPTTLSCWIGLPALTRAATGLQHNIPCGQRVGQSDFHGGRFPKTTAHIRPPTFVHTYLVHAPCKGGRGETLISKGASTSSVAPT